MESACQHLSNDHAQPCSAGTGSAERHRADIQHTDAATVSAAVDTRRSSHDTSGAQGRTDVLPAPRLLEDHHRSGAQRSRTGIFLAVARHGHTHHIFILLPARHTSVSNSRNGQSARSACSDTDGTDNLPVGNIVRTAERKPSGSHTGIHHTARGVRPHA